MAAGPLGEARAAAGATVETFALLEQAVQQAASIRFVAVLPEVLRALAEGYLLASRLAEARHSAERVLQLSRAQGQRHVEADALRILGDVYARANPDEAGQAEAWYREALGVAEQIGTPPLAARCHLGLGVLFRATGQLESAQHHLATAATMFLDMDMRSWLEKAQAEMDEGSR